LETFQVCQSNKLGGKIFDVSNNIKIVESCSLSTITNWFKHQMTLLNCR